MKILVDADSCPRPARETVLRASARTGVRVIFAANRPIPGIAGETVVMELCPSGENAADNRIVELARPGDLALTRDIPLAGRLVEAAVLVMDDRGRVYTKENIREQRSLRDFMLELADKGLGGDRRASYSRRELKIFADTFDRILSRLIREEKERDRQGDNPRDYIPGM
ncbi:MAG: DUF188 domain-containing protein [Treponema sp.]|jgi:uncharacterized protein YaiI (UPF0178 family)|nr:DUF188 domain-containing protein [Treponema sp.]